MTARSANRVELVDYARGLAAFAVVFFHYFYNGIANGKIESVSAIPVISEIARYGYLGVDVFFMISGFVIANSAVGKSARDFAVGRAVRLYPAFWVAMIITTGFIVVLGGSQMSVTPQQFLANATMVPQVFRQPFVDGAYWTLAYELAFYFFVFLIIIAKQGRRLDTILCSWAVLLGVLSLVAPSLGSVPLLGNYFALFAVGAVVSSIRRSGWSIFRIAGLVGGLVAALPFQMRGGVERGLDPVVLAIIFVATYGFILATLSNRVSEARIPGSRWAGQITYPLYLLHAYIGYILINAIGNEDNKLLVTFGVMAFIVMLAYALHFVVEQRMRPVWLPFFDGTIGRVVGRIETRRPQRRRPRDGKQDDVSAPD